MNIIGGKGNWNEQKGKLEQKFAVLTENDQMFEEGKKKEVIGRIQTRFSKTREELQRIIAAL